QLRQADLMRRAVSKKKQKELVKHKGIFLERGPENDIPEKTAEAIFDDIEFFANYGFNKSHAADYAMVTVQTGFLKCHYPAEYMAALLSVYREDTTKVSAFLEECGRLNISILPPDVNYSNSDFDIQTLDDDTRGVRFGMAAIKNAGVAAVQYILNAREEGVFKDLTDFCERVDLRHVGKRTLESLVKVGALDTFAENRNQLLQVLDRLMSFSADHHKAKEVGQISMFGADSGVQDTIQLPVIDQVALRERLDWEKELLGFYVTDHPVDAILRKIDAGATLRTFQFHELDEYYSGGVGIVALISNIREIPTKRGDMMAVLTLEDRYGSLEVVLFPRTWDGYKHVVRENENDVVLVKGKFDRRNDRPQILVDSVTTEFEVFTRADGVIDGNGNNGNGYSEPLPPSADVTITPPPDEDGPPPIDWSGYGGAATTGVASTEHTGYGAAIAHAKPSESAAITLPPQDVPSGIDWDSEFESNPDLTPHPDAKDNQQWAIAVYLQPDDNPEVTRRRLRRIHGQFTEYRGEDRFMIIVEHPEKPYKMEFPKHRTGWCNALEAALIEIVGAENIEVFEDS
ncbi:MAG: OB-fold nucleic acid binding domain-containing protein, partial [Chloroflexota bacterium]